MTSTNPARVALGLAALAAERVQAGTPNNTEVLATAVGLIEEARQAVRDTARRVGASRVGRPLWGAARRVPDLPGAAAIRSPLQNARARASQTAAAARARGRGAVVAGRAEAAAFVRSNVDEAVGWLMPRVIDKALPEIRTRILPVVVEDLAADPRVRDLLLEQSRDVLGEAAGGLRGHTATADDRVESAFRRMIGDEPPGTQPAPGG